MTAKIKLNAASGGGSVSLEAPTSTTNDANVEFKLPVADGTSGQALTTNASGQLAFATISSNPTTTSGTDNFTVADGNLVIGTSGHGIDFSAASGSAAGASSSILDDYEEGTWTVEIVNGFASGLTYSTQAGHYRKIGTLVEFNFFILIANESNDTNAQPIKISLPFTQDGSSSKRGHGIVTYHNIQSAYPDSQNPHIYVYNSKAELYGYSGIPFSGNNGANQGNRYIIAGGHYYST